MIVPHFNKGETMNDITEARAMTVSEAKALQAGPQAPSSPLAAILSDPSQLKDMPVDNIERMFALYERDVARQELRDFNAAKLRIQGQLEPVKKLATNKHTGSMYARAEDVEKMLMPIIAREGMTVSVSTVEPVVPGTMRIQLQLSYAGHSEYHHMDAPVDDKGPGGKPTKTSLHGTASTLTYCRRHLLCNVFGVLLAGKGGIVDDDGNQGRQQQAAVITVDQAANVMDLVAEVKADKAAMLEWLGVQAIKDIPAARYAEVVAMLERKR